MPAARLTPLILAFCTLALASGCGALFGHRLPEQPPPLASLEEPLELQAEPDDEELRASLPPGAFSGVYGADARASLDEMLDEPPGVEVARVVENSPGEAAGLEEGDLLLEARTPDGRTHPLRWPSDWRELELELPAGTELELLYDRAGVELTTRLALAARVRAGERTPSVRLREDERVGVVVRGATEVEARAVDLAPGAGAVVVGLAADSPWRKAGVRFEDLILSVDGARVAHPQMVLDAIRTAEPRQKLELEIARKAERVTLSAAVSGRESDLSHISIPLLFSYEHSRNASETSMLLGLFRLRRTRAAWDVRLFWLISFGGGDADKLEQVRF